MGVVRCVPGHTAGKIGRSEAQADARTNQCGADQHAPVGARLRSKSQNNLFPNCEGGSALLDLTPRTPLLVLEAFAGRPVPISVRDEATANGEGRMNTFADSGKSFLHCSIDVGLRKGLFPFDPLKVCRGN